MKISAASRFMIVFEERLDAEGAERADTTNLPPTLDHLRSCRRLVLKKEQDKVPAALEVGSVSR